MDLTFLGTGEAFDANRANTSYLIEEGKESVMVDCGYNTPQSLRKHLEKQGGNYLKTPDNVILTHFHGDHFAGLSAFLILLWDKVRESGTRRDLTIASALPDVKEKVGKRMNEDYPGLYSKFGNDGLKINFRNINSTKDKIGELEIYSAETKHSAPNYAYRFESNGKSLAISGDGALSDESKQLYKGVNFLAHEGFFVDTSFPTHASIKEVVEYAISANIKKVGIVHINQEERTKKSEIEKIVKSAEENKIRVFFPKDHQQIQI